MPRVVTFHLLAPRPGVKPEDIEKVLLEVTLMQPFQNWKMHFAKADRGTHVNKYALIWEFESVEARNRFYPEAGGTPAPELQRLMESIGDLMEKWYSMVEETEYTDYVMIER